MKSLKKIIILPCLLLISVAVSAQLSVGLRGGVNIATQTFEADGFDISPDNIMGLTLAGILELGLTENFAIQPEIAFVQKGYQIDIEIFGTKSSIKNRVNHIDFPILAKYKFGGEAIGAYVAAGPTFGYAMSGSITEDGDKEKYEDWEDYNRFEVGGSLGGGLRFGKFFVDVRYLLGFTNLFTGEDDEISKARNRGISLSVGFLSNL